MDVTEVTRCECGNVATEGNLCEWCAYPECEVLVTVFGAPELLGAEVVGVCSADGRPIYRSRMAGTIYHATEVD